jgi:hypothetical protein
MQIYREIVRIEAVLSVVDGLGFWFRRAWKAIRYKCSTRHVDTYLVMKESELSRVMTCDVHTSPASSPCTPHKERGPSWPSPRYPTLV